MCHRQRIFVALVLGAVTLALAGPGAIDGAGGAAEPPGAPGTPVVLTLRVIDDGAPQFRWVNREGHCDRGRGPGTHRMQDLNGCTMRRPITPSELVTDGLAPSIDESLDAEPFARQAIAETDECAYSETPRSGPGVTLPLTWAMRGTQGGILQGGIEGGRAESSVISCTMI
jgi:hypothetical protein